MRKKRSDPVINRYRQFLRSTLLFAFPGALLFAGTYSSSSAREAQEHAKSSTPQVSDRAAQEAQSAEAERTRLRQTIDATKASLANTPHKEVSTRAFLLDQLKAAHDKSIVSIPGASGLPSRAPIAPTSGTHPDLTARYQKLLTKMSAYDMKKPEDVSAWAELKKKELGE